jgi:hypothetical protein
VAFRPGFRSAFGGPAPGTPSSNAQHRGTSFAVRPNRDDPPSGRLQSEAKKPGPPRTRRSGRAT